MGNRIGGGRDIYPHAALDLIAAAADGDWIKFNSNTYQSAWPHVDLRAWYGGGPGDPKNVIDAWSSFGWDAKRSRLVLFGGGHANYNGNEVYVFDARTLQWSLGYHSHDRDSANMTTLEQRNEWQHGPISAHTYDNQSYLPNLDRFLTWGGAQAGDGGSWAVLDPDTGATVRLIAGYYLDPSRFGQGRVGGRTGSNAHRGVYAGVDLPGAYAWTPIDYEAEQPVGWELVEGRGRINGVGDVVDDNGVDVVLQTFNSGTSRALRRIRMPSLDPAAHTIIGCGSGGAIGSAFGAGCYVPTHGAFVLTGKDDELLYFWRDVMTETNAIAPSYTVLQAGLTGTGASEVSRMRLNGTGNFNPGMDWDKAREKLVCWKTGGLVLGITPPAGSPMATTDWSVEVLADPLTGDMPDLITQDKGVLGKWKYAADLDVFIALQDTALGNVWAWRPHGWTDPRTA